MFGNIATLFVFGILIVSEFMTLSNGVEKIENRGELKNFDFAGAPLYFATILNMFEGNAMILNIYAEADKP